MPPQTLDHATGRGDVVYRSLRAAILERALAPGTKLPEGRIGKLFDVSRTVVRSAIDRLGVEGLVQIRKHRGAAVAEPTIEEAHEVFAMRRCLEQEALRLLPCPLPDRMIARLEAHVAREDASRDQEPREAIRLSGEFHALVAEMTGNRVLARYVGELVSRSSLILALYGAHHSSECAVNEHRDIIAALAQGERERAETLMMSHLGAVEDRAMLEEITPPANGLDDILGRYAGAD